MTARPVRTNEVGKMRVNWVTHLPAPYRVPVFRALMQTWDLEVQCTEREDRIGTTGSENRGEDWKHSAFPDVPFRTLRTLRLRWKGVPLYVLLSRGTCRPQRVATSVLIGGWEVPAYWQTLAIARFLGQRTVGFYESPPATHKFSTGIISVLRRIFFSSLDAVVTPGSAATAGLLAMGIDRSKIYEGFNAVDVAFFAEATRALRRTDFTAGGYRFLYVGQFIARKRLLPLIRAFGAARGPEDHLTLVGSGAQRGALTAEVQRLHLEPWVTLHAPILNGDLPKVFADHDALVLISEEEVWGLVVNEALAAGLRVVVSGNCGVASSVAQMEGVNLVSEDLSDLPATLRALSARAEPHIQDPSILKLGPSEFAKVFDSALKGIPL